MVFLSERQQMLPFLESVSAGTHVEQVASFLRQLADAIERGEIQAFDNVRWSGQEHYGCAVLSEGRYQRFQLRTRSPNDERQRQLTLLVPAV